MKKILVFSMTFLIAQAIFSQEVKNYELNLEVMSKNLKGNLMLAVFDSPTSWQKHQPIVADMEQVNADTMHYTFKLPKGIYGISLFVDENKNFTFDYGAESYAFSNQYEPTRYPLFSDFAFELKQDTVFYLNLIK